MSARRLLAALPILFALLPTVVPAADSHSADPLARAQTLLRQGEGQAAVEILRDLAADEDPGGAIWLTLGQALRAVESYEESARALRLALIDEESRSQAAFELARTLAHLDVDRAFSWLREVHAAGTHDLTALAYDRDLRALAQDPRAAELRPREADFADPFVEEVRVLVEWVGEAPGDQFGWIARRVADVDGDGVDDVVTSAPTWGAENSRRGRIYLLSTGTGERLWTHDGEAGDQLGHGVESAGDVDADGVDDVVASSARSDYALVLSGRDGSVLLRLRPKTTGIRFGLHAAGVGDVDADGHADVLVGAPDSDAGGEDSGEALLFSGADGRLLQSWAGPAAGARLGSTVAGATTDEAAVLILGAPGVEGGGRVFVHRDLRAEPAFVIAPGEHGRRLGAMFVSAVGDVDGDGVLDVYASDWWNAARGPMTGRVFVHSGVNGERLHVLTGEEAGEGFGIGVADAGDVDDDGHDDLVIGAWRHDGAAPMGGRVTVFSGRDGRVLRRITGQVPGETLGFDTTHLGDVDGDGLQDLLVTSAWSAVAGARSGRIWVLAGEP